MSLLSLLRHGLDTVQIAEHLNATEAEVYNFMAVEREAERQAAPEKQKRKFTPPLMPETIIEIRRLRADGWLLKQIADHFEISKTAVHNALDEEFSELRNLEVARYERQLNANSRKRGDGSSRRPLHLEKYHQARRGFHVPEHLEDRYFDLLKSGIPIADARRQIGLSCGS